ncbi:GntR family transcriptional regulator [Sinomonas sp. ASV322]|uniref:GntR family transcriptional regulator n=1 Tax=Sinomonas sp. ASV322 TaxID=3041920 RepID=UPI0027DC78B4|nr:GntR family transcriptional regulator [Sinomonas sp. ASV322]MDQ4502743.1 GntR family transcriptional regulator [Sinomonas sp. ASV322]
MAVGDASAAARPQYRKLAANLREAIASGAYQDGRLPSEETLAAQHGMSRGTVRQALALLRANGVVTSRRGTPRVILGTARTQSFYELMSFTSWARAVGEEPGGHTLAFEHRPGEPWECAQLDLEPGSMLYFVLRARTLSRVPVMAERTLYPEAVGRVLADLGPDAISHMDPLVDEGLIFADLEHSIDLISANAEDARILDIPQGSPLLRERRRATDPSGVVLHWSDDRFLPGTVSFTVHSSAAVTSMSRRRG